MVLTVGADLEFLTSADVRAIQERHTEPEVMLLDQGKQAFPLAWRMKVCVTIRQVRGSAQNVVHLAREDAVDGKLEVPVRHLSTWAAHLDQGLMQRLLRICEHLALILQGRKERSAAYHSYANRP